VDGGSSLLVACQGEDPASEEAIVQLRQFVELQLRRREEV